MLLTGILTAAVAFLIFYGRIPPIALAACCVLPVLLPAASLRGNAHRHGGMVAIDHEAQRSGLGGLHAGTKMLLAVGSAFLCVSAESWVFPVLIFTLMSCFTLLAGRTRPGLYLSVLRIPQLFILAGVLAILIEITPHPLGLLDIPLGSVYLSITPAGQRNAGLMVAKSFGAVSCLYMLSLSTPVPEIIDSLRRIRVPSIIIELMYLIYRYLFILLEACESMSTAAKSRLGYRNYASAIKTILSNALYLFLISLRRATDSFTAMEARCYTGEIRFLSKRRGLRHAEAAGSLCYFAILSALWWITGRLL